MAGKGLDITPIRWPEKYDAAWFERFFRETVGPLADARNAIAGPGIAISASPTEPPTIAGSADVQALVTASLITVLPEAELPRTRQLAGETGVIEIIDGGGGEPVTIALQSIPLTKLQRIPGLSVVGSAISGDPDEFVPSAITAGANDLLLARVGDELLFSQLTTGMFPAEVVPDAALSANVALYDDDVGQFSSGTFADARIAESNVTQHQAALAIDWSQLDSIPAFASRWPEWDEVTDKPTFGTAAFIDEDALSIDWSQLTNVPSLGGQVDSVVGTAGQIDVDSSDAANPELSLADDVLAALLAAVSAVQPGDLAAVATSGAYSDLSGTPSLATVATTGDYDDLGNLPTLGTAAAIDEDALSIDWSQLTSVPSEFPPEAHTHNASDIDSGTLADGRLSSNVPLKNASNTFTTTQTIGASTAILRLDATGAAENQRLTRMFYTGTNFTIHSRLDNDSGGSNLLTAARSGTTWTSLALSATSITANGAEILTAGDNISDLVNDEGYLTDINSESLGDLGDVNIGTPGSGEDGYVLAWDNDEGEFVLVEQTGSGLPADPDADALLMWDDSDGAAKWITEIADSFLSDNVPLKDVQNTFAGSSATSWTLRSRNTNNGTGAFANIGVQNDGSSEFLMTLAGSGYTGALVTGGPSGTSAALRTTTAIPLSLGTNNVERIRISESGAITLNGVNITDYARLSQSNTFTTTQTIGASTAILRLDATGAAENQRLTRMFYTGTNFTIHSRLDNDSGGSNLLTAARSGTTWTSLALSATSITANGNEVAAMESGSFTATLTGMSGTVTGTVQWRRTGNKVTLFAPSAITGTSNATTMTLTGLPAAIQPASAQFRPCGLFTNNETAIFLGGAEFAASSGTVTMWLFSGGASLPVTRTSFAALGAKGLSAGWSVEYDIS